ncbi:unnamed protein product [Bursaphelenchus xylophilus]|uniref:(pine wood nematode) hypothetical protein n=1 Tax=Bursaphelenchus xylophilus TaxID=6326 RepID=A0A7I8XG52_BURXY|nr:unnamed protein product [Bursaphelenchus xylophilus]CAG9123710.1 unnamed protein product [Bursaphelenchus xylophilus]
MSWQLTFVFLFPIITHVCAEVTHEPQHTPTGILSQFQGFRTPRPFPPNANFMYASVWASWSAWSFCANGVQVRVRACNTVRGFSCLGANRETKDCENPTRPLPLPQPGNQAPRRTQNQGRPDYDVVDPWDDDRKEALRQLGQYTDYEVPELKNQKPQQDLKLRGEKTAKKFGLRGPERPLQNGVPLLSGPAQAPSMTPEKLYGSKTETGSPVVELPLTGARGSSTTEGELSTSTTIAQTIAETRPVTETTSNQPVVRNEETTIDNDIIVTSTVEPTTNQNVESNDKVEIVSSISQHFKEQQLEQGVNNTPLTPALGIASVNEESIASVIEEEATGRSRAQTPTMTPSGRTRISVPIQPPPTIIFREQKTTLSPIQAPTTKKINSGEVEAPKKPEVVNVDTVKALQWMLNNMTNAAKQADTKRIHQMNLDSSVLHSAPLVDNDESDLLGNEKILQEELVRLKSTMDQVESELKELENDEIESEKPKFDTKKALSLNLVPQAKTVNSQEMIDSSPEILDQNQRQAKWSNWGPWGNCLCGKQMRTRACHYGVYSGGCVGRSYQSRLCRSYDDDSCPTPRHSHENGLVSTLHEGSAFRRPS